MEEWITRTRKERYGDGVPDADEERVRSRPLFIELYGSWGKQDGVGSSVAAQITRCLRSRAEVSIIIGKVGVVCWKNKNLIKSD